MSWLRLKHRWSVVSDVMAENRSPRAERVAATNPQGAFFKFLRDRYVLYIISFFILAALLTY